MIETSKQVRLKTYTYIWDKRGRGRETGKNKYFNYFNENYSNQI